MLWLAFWNKSQDSFFKRMISIVYCLSLSFSANRKVCSYAYMGRTMTASVFHFAEIYQTTQVFYGYSGFLRQKRWVYKDKSQWKKSKNALQLMELPLTTANLQCRWHVRRDSQSFWRLIWIRNIAQREIGYYCPLVRLKFASEELMSLHKFSRLKSIIPLKRSKTH